MGFEVVVIDVISSAPEVGVCVMEGADTIVSEHRFYSGLLKRGVRWGGSACA